MKYNALGKTGISVSEIGLGGEHLQGKDFDTVNNVVSAALDGGVNIIDVFMSEPNVRENIGKSLKGRRDKVVLQGHIGSVWQNGQYACSRDVKVCREFIDDFLKRFSTDYIDFGMLHYVDTAEDLQSIENGGILDFARELKKAGIIRAIGMSSHDPAVAKRAVEAGWIDMLMFSVNPAYDLLPENTYIDNYFNVETWSADGLSGMNPNRAALYKACDAHGVGITVMKAFGGGMLFNPKLSAFGKAISPNKLIAYALDRPAVSSVLIGCQNVDEVEQALAYENATADERDYVSELASTSLFGKTKWCVYCNHCLPCPVKIDVAQVNRLLDRLKSCSGDETEVRAKYAALSPNAGDCIECGMCESRCPFGVRVTERMKEANALFGTKG